MMAPVCVVQMLKWFSSAKSDGKIKILLTTDGTKTFEMSVEKDQPLKPHVLEIAQKLHIRSSELLLLRLDQRMNTELTLSQLELSNGDLVFVKSEFDVLVDIDLVSNRNILASHRFKIDRRANLKSLRSLAAEQFSVSETNIDLIHRGMIMMDAIVVDTICPYTTCALRAVVARSEC
ncbi:hypothetical protein HDE_00942 [Halotydeus destructor]|nr:hypothetical protein HDE_00942 [Halotydeus destructor]